jgi:hypothetical protein
MNKGSLIPRAARDVAGCFSTASIKIVSINYPINIISRNRTCHVEVSPPSVVATVRGPGRRPTTIPEDAILAAIWTGMRRTPLTYGTALTSYSAIVT